MAVDSLASSAEPIQRRLFWAGLSLIPLLDEDFIDVANREKFSTIVAALTRVQAVGDEGDLEATISVMSDEDGVAVARMIVELDRAVRPLS